MTDRELMQMALDALEGYARNCQCEGGGAPCDAAKALRARLEQPEPEPEVGVCCQEFDKCLRSCTPRGQWIAHVRCDCGDQIMPDDGAECGTCVTARNAVKGEWQGLTNDEVNELSHLMVKEDKSVNWLTYAIEAKLKEKNSG